jgi:hypothetical protein
MEPERKIEKLLRAYAKKRRVQAGDPQKLHPAARRRLQEEIARRASAADEEDVSLTLWELFRQRWAFLLGFALVVFFVATQFLPALNRAKFKGQKETATARYNLIEIGTAVRMYAEDNHQRLPASLDELTNELQLDLMNTIFIDPQNGQRFVYVGGGKRLDALPGNALLAYSPTDKKGHAVLFADGRVEVVGAARFSELTNRGLSQLAVAKDAERRQFAPTAAQATVGGDIAGATAPTAGQLKSKDDGDKSGSINGGRLSQTNGELAAGIPAQERHLAYDGQILFKNIAAPVGAQAAAVLANFQLQQAGNTIRVVDADGSVYDGSILPANETGQSERAAEAMPMERARTVAVQDGLQTAPGQFFRVAGTNLTLKQKVVFSGDLLAISSVMTNLQSSEGNIGGSAGGGGPSSSATTNQSSWPVSRVTGTAAIGATNTIEINAVPRSP